MPSSFQAEHRKVTFDVERAALAAFDRVALGRHRRARGARTAELLSGLADLLSRGLAGVVDPGRTKNYDRASVNVPSELADRAEAAAGAAGMSLSGLMRAVVSSRAGA